jgi:hypothetical protein
VAGVMDSQTLVYVDMLLCKNEQERNFGIQSLHDPLHSFSNTRVSQKRNIETNKK